MISRLDHCNSLLYGLQQKDLHRESSLNSAPHLQSSPQYLSDLLCINVPSRPLRAGAVRPRNNLQIVRSRTKTYGDRAFAVAAPVLWNALPENIRQLPNVAQFKGRLKAHLFN